MVYRVQDLFVHSVGMFDWLARPGYVQDLTLGWIKFHIPCFLPLLENIKIIPYLVDTLLMIGKIFKPWWLIIPFDVLIFRCRRFRLDCDKLTI